MNEVEIGRQAQVLEALANFKTAKDLAKRAEALKAESEAVLREALGDAKVATVMGVVAYKVEERTRTTINTEALKTEYPEVFDEVRGESRYDFIKAL
jgi:predicted phage-related endonuclease